ncbi:hypothetical protein ALC62_00758 [Cyphomyrmex costatus]|uniref:Uncharacterized protein n=1 Tax=Cyphomyrmex costatus TaxID=456900 RepID=A0A151IQF0_9HYME|nr:hypothetical protein ALC62_00758 [Cyphomyrmex costatus]
MCFGVSHHWKCSFLKGCKSKRIAYGGDQRPQSVLIFIALSPFRYTGCPPAGGRPQKPLSYKFQDDWLSRFKDIDMTSIDVVTRSGTIYLDVYRRPHQSRG